MGYSDDDECKIALWDAGDAVVESYSLHKERSTIENYVVLPLTIVSAIKDFGYMGYYCIYKDPNWYDSENEKVKGMMSVLSASPLVADISDPKQWIDAVLSFVKSASTIYNDYVDWDNLDPFYFGKGVGYSILKPILAVLKLALK